MEAKKQKTNNEDMQELRCSDCDRFLLKYAFGQFEVKCPNCKSINHVKSLSQKHLHFD